MVPFVYPTEIFPVSVRAFGNKFGVAGYANLLYFLPKYHLD
jgi:hypothetical protein